MDNSRLLPVKQYIKAAFEGTRPLEISEIILMMLFVVIYPFSWQLALWVGLLLLLNAAARMIRYHCYGNNFSTLSRWALCLLPALYLFYLASITYSTNTAEGWEILFHKLPMLLFPIYFLVADTRFLSHKLLILLGYCFAISCTLLGAAFIFTRLFQILFAGASFNVLFSTGFLVPHHTYASMYFLLSITFLYLENKHHGNEYPRWWNIIIWVCIAFLIAITFFIQSRSGVLCLICLVLWALYDIIFNRKMRLLGFGLTGTALLFFALVTLAPGDSHNRLNSTVKEVSGGDTGDIRFEIWGNALQVIKENPIWGIGVGDRMDVLEENHERNFLMGQNSNWHRYNPHNQFLDTWVALGIFGLFTLLAIFLLPLIYALRDRPRNILLLTFIAVAFVSSLVESTLERQMGIIFFCFAYGILQLPAGSSDTYVPAANDKSPHTIIRRRKQPKKKQYCPYKQR